MACSFRATACCSGKRTRTPCTSSATPACTRSCRASRNCCTMRGLDELAEKDYSHRDVVDKLGIKPGFAIAFDEAPRPIPDDLKARVLARVGRDEARADE